MVHIPVVKVSVVRESTQPAEDRKADTPEKVAGLVRELIGGDDREHFVAVLLSARHSVVGLHVVSVGTLTASLVHPREVFRPAIVAGAAAVIVAHNHPSGEATPSPEDKMTTKRIVMAGDLLGISVLDHVIVANDAHFSFREMGLL